MDKVLKAKGEELVLKFKNLKSRNDVADLLEIRSKDLIYLLYREPEKNYKNFSITKKSGGTRDICAPISSLKILQSKLNYILSLIYTPRASVHGFTNNRSILTNSESHIRKSYILNIDLKDFFPSINFGRVRGMFINFYHMPSEPATVLAQICCYNNALPQGAPSSPIITNIICSSMDSQLQKLAHKYSCTYTRYADDISLSTTLKIFPEQLAKKDDQGKTMIEAELLSIIKQNGFQINENKIRLLNKKSRLEVTGLTVNEFPNVQRKFIRQVRAMLHAWEKYGKDAVEKEYWTYYQKKYRLPEKGNPRFVNVVKGKINYIRMIRGEDDPLYRNLSKRFNSINGGGFPDYPVSNIYEDRVRELSSALWILECEEEVKQGTGFMLEGVGLVTCHHVLGKATHAYQYNDFTKYPVKVMYDDKDNDIAILSIDAPNQSCFKAQTSGKLHIGANITVVGFPNYNPGDTPYISDGKITLYRPSQRRYMVDATIVTGNSGGPVLNSENKVVGIAVMGVDEFCDSSKSEKHGVIPINIIDFLIDNTP